MRVVLADLESNRGFVSKDTVVGGYGSRLEPFSRVTNFIAYLKKWYHDVPSVHMAYSAAILARAGHEVKWTRGELVDGDVALVLSSLVDYKAETAWADEMRARGVKVGFIGITASKMPELFRDHADFIFNGEPEAGVMRLAQGDVPSGMTVSEQINDLDALPFPRWDLVTEDRGFKAGIRFSSRPVGGGFPLLASRGPGARPVPWPAVRRGWSGSNASRRAAVARPAPTSGPRPRAGAPSGRFSRCVRTTPSPLSGAWAMAFLIRFCKICRIFTSS